MDVVIACYKESGQGSSAVADPNLTIPLLMRNRVQGGFETDDRLDIALRPHDVCLTLNGDNCGTDCIVLLLYFVITQPKE